ncbi:MAG: hypothetical protein CMO44_07435 [Verrucomicrobiales bacterium]|nr:hypothetical protein [Verrucomicrobiales bacterium]
MSVLKSVVDVNNGNSGWTAQNVMDAFETALGNLGLNAGSTISGVPQVCMAPDGSTTTLRGNLSALRDANNADQGETSWGSTKTHYYKVTEVGTDYKLEKKVGSGYAPYYASMVDQTTDELIYARHGFKTGDPVRYLPGETDAQYSLGTNLAPDTLVYIINVSRDRFKVATSAVNATNGTAIDIDGVASTNAQFDVVWQQEAQQASDYINPTIDIYHGDNIQFENIAGNTTNITVCRDVDSFDNDQRIVYNDPTYGSTPDNEISISYRTNTTNVSCVPGSNLIWDTQSYPQSESEPLYPASLLNPSWTAEHPGAEGIRKYIYCSETTATAKGVINLLPGNVNADLPSQVNSDPYYKYTVPASGGRSELKLRVWRGGYNDNYIKNITIHNIATGWSDDEEFTIPGELVGGTATTGDIRFGVTTPESSSNAYDGTASIKTTTIGGGSDFYQKHNLGRFAILNVENDATKKYSNTFYSFYLEGDAGTTWKLYMQVGNGWEFLNYGGTSSPALTPSSSWGRFSGYEGLDNSNNRYISNSYVTSLTLSTNSTPTAYPMQIKTFRAQSPQDTDFAVIQFTQTINEKVEPFATFNFHVGDGYGNGVFDLDEVFLGAITQYEPSTSQYITIRTTVPGYSRQYYSSYAFSNEPVDANSQARNAYYGYMRGYNSFNYVTDNYYNNIRQDTGNATTVYYRNSTYDKYNNVSMDSGADYYKPIKTIPVSQRMIPCPYYIPDDFVLLQVVTTPGLTEFRPGDTVTVSGSEIYEVVSAGYATQQLGLDGVTNNSSEGMLFLARTT